MKLGFKKLWILRRLKVNGANISELCDIYTQHVISLLEYSAAVWHSALTEVNRTDIERVQKAAFTIILGSSYLSYRNALVVLGMTTLDERRDSLCLKFVKKAVRSTHFSSLFVEDNKEINTRRQLKLIKEADLRSLASPI